MPLRTSPTVIRHSDFQNSIPRRKATSEPVQAPLLGKWIITKITRKISPHMMNLCACLECVFLKSLSKKLSNHFEYFRRSCEIGSRSFRIKIATNMFPKVAQRNAW